MRSQRSARTSRPRVSYRESSAEDDDKDDNFALHDFEDIALSSDRPSQRRHSARAAPQLRSSLKEPSSDEDEEDDFISLGDDIENDSDNFPFELPPAKRRRTAVKPIATRTRQANVNRSSQTTPKRLRGAGLFLARRHGRNKLSKSKQTSKTWMVMETDGVCPPWHTLPFHVLLSIFDYAYEQQIQASANNASVWLSNVARTCTTFAEPALTILYRKPLLINGRRIQDFTNHIALARNSDRQFLNYPSKVKHLRIDERVIPSGFDLVRLIQDLPQLAHIELYSSKDLRPLRGHSHIIAEKYWKYPNNLFEVIRECKLPLVSWQWNYNLGSLGMLLESGDSNTNSQALSSPFHKLKEMIYTSLISCQQVQNYPLPFGYLKPMVYDAVDLDLVPALALSEMKYLRLLRLEYCKAVTGMWLQHLPKHITTLELCCCPGVDAAGFQEYLESHGSELRTLVLDHNINLGLDFLSILKLACPHLRELSMDLIYFDIDRVSVVMKPGYENILPAGLTPTWPTELEKLNLSHLRRWESSEQLVTFFESIIENAENLPKLRHLALSISINLTWHERAGFRDKWTSLFEKVFLRKTKSPATFLQSFKAYRLYKESLTQKPKHKRSSSHDSSASSSAGRLRPKRRVNYTSDGSNVAGSQMSLRGRVFAALKDGPSVSQATEGDTQYIHGLCDVVDIRIDNSRPKEREFRESDMLDSEESGDSDYDS
jgi:hypothetical protein